MTSKLDIKKLVGKLLTNKSFIRKSDTWYIKNKETISVINIQKSNYDNLFYINLGIYFRCFGKDLFPKENACHIRIRSDSLASGSAKNLHSILNLEEQSSNSKEVESNLKLIFFDYCIPFLNSCNNLEKAKDAYKKGTLNKAMVYRQLKEQFEKTH